MPVLRKIGAEADTVGEWLLAVAKHWRALLTGPGLSVAILIYSLATNKPIPPSWYAYTMLVGIPIAFYLAWREEHRKVGLSPDVASLHEANTRRESEIAALRNQLGRRLSAEQKGILRSALQPLVEQLRSTNSSDSDRLGIIIHAASGSDAEDFKNDFVELFESMSFWVGRFAKLTDSAELHDHNRHGLWVRWNSENEDLPVGQTLIDALRRSDIEVTPLDLRDEGDLLLELIVYRRAD